MFKANTNIRLEFFSSVIYHHLGENPNIAYGVLQSRKTFEDLGTFTLTRGLREVKRVQLAKEAKKLSNPKGKTPGVDGVEMVDAGAEKAQLLENEGAGNRGSQERDQGSGGSPRDSQADETVTRSFISPTSETLFASPDSPISEKVRGKMRERRSLSPETLNSLDRVPLNIGRNGFVPTQEWVCGLHLYYFTMTYADIPSGNFMAARVHFVSHKCSIPVSCLKCCFFRLPLDTVMIFISAVIQRVEDMQKHSAVPSTEVIKFLSSVSLDGVIPSNPPISARRFMVCWIYFQERAQKFTQALSSGLMRLLYG